MGLPPNIPTLILMVVMWAVVLWLVRKLGARVAVNPSPRAVRSYRLHVAAAISAMVGVTWFSAWLMTDAGGPHWLHALSAPTALVFIAVGAAIAGYAGWLGGP